MAARPNFLIIAAQKSASIWLRDNLKKHPDIYLRKGIVHFFNAGWAEGVDWYFDQFEPEDGEAFVGEHCPSYAHPRSNIPTTADRIQATLPDVRLLAIIRNPVDRAYSAFIHHMTRGRIPVEADMFDYLDKHYIVEAGKYAQCLQPYYDRFGDALHVVLLEDVKTRGEDLYRGVLDHLGADSSFVPDDLTAVVHSRRPPVESPYREGEGKRKLTPEERARLHAFYHEDILRLQELLGRDLSMWLKDGEPSAAA